MKSRACIVRLVRWACPLCAVLLLPGHVASAQLNPDPDQVGIYFDPDAATICEPVTPGADFTLYLVLSNPSAATGISGWTVTIEFPPGAVVQSSYLPGDPLNVFSPPEYAVGLYQPLPWAPNVVLAEFTLQTSSPDCEWVYLGPCCSVHQFPLLAYADGADPASVIQMHGSTHGWPPDFDIPVAGINCNCPPPVMSDKATWGTLKTIYK